MPPSPLYKFSSSVDWAVSLPNVFSSNLLLYNIMSLEEQDSERRPKHVTNLESMKPFK